MSSLSDIPLSRVASDTLNRREFHFRCIVAKSINAQDVESERNTDSFVIGICGCRTMDRGRRSEKIISDIEAASIVSGFYNKISERMKHNSC